jgi:hypothetical protein
MSAVRTGRNVQRWAPAIVLALALASVWADTPWAQTQGRVIYMATIEPRGGAQQDKEPPFQRRRCLQARGTEKLRLTRTGGGRS